MYARKVTAVSTEDQEIIAHVRRYIVKLEGYEEDDRFILKSPKSVVYQHDRDYSLTEETRKKYYDRGYAEGYTVGYEWLDRGWNFVHYNERGGYVPGGPVTLTITDREVNNGWRDGWKDGIDKYVADKNYVIGTKGVNR